MINNYYTACMLFAAGGGESAKEIAKRFGVTRQAIYKRAEFYREKLNLRKPADRRFGASKSKIMLSGLLNMDVPCP